MSASSSPSLVLGRYRLGPRLGAGGFGVVFRGRDERLGRDVAVKRLPREAVDPERVEQEARASARLGHPAIVALYEAGADRDAAYLVSELVDGPTLAELLREPGALDDEAAVAIGAELAAGLAHAHARGVVHRDVKPANVLVPCDPASGDAVAKLTDFGIARVVGEEALTRTGDVVGTLAYMAPEQAEGRGAREASDVYALGVVLFEALAGHNPRRGATPAETARRVSAPFPLLRRARPDLPRGLCEAIDAAVAVDPAGRPTAAELRDDLLDAPDLTGSAPATRVQPPAPLLHERDRRPPDPARVPDEAHAPSRGTWAHQPPQPRRRSERRPRGRLGLAARVQAGVAAGALVALALDGLGPSAGSLSPVVAAACVAAAVAVLPRVAWSVVVVALLAWVAVDGEQGTAVALLAATALVPVLLLRAPATWSLPAAAPLLGAVGLAGGFPALAGRARTAIQRGALGALGALWLALAEALTDTRLLAGTPAPPSWEDSATSAVEDVLGGLASSPTPAIAVTWALAAVVLPFVVRGRSAPTDAAAAIAWAAVTAVATSVAVPGGAPRGAAGGALLAAVLAIGAAAVRHGRARSMARPAHAQPDPRP